MTPRPALDDLAALAALGTATIGEVAGGAVRILDGGLRPLAPHAPAVAGVALTVRCRPGDNLALHLALAQAQPGDLLVVDYGGDVSTGPFGEIMALAADIAGIRGLVIDGAVRDSTAIVRMGFATFCRGIAIAGTAKRDRGAVGAGCTVGGVDIRPGEVIVGDGDAVIAVDPGAMPGIIAEGRTRLSNEEQVMDRLRRGETTCEIFGLS
ncbi:RraA family protein [Rhodobacteraceae bacterium 2CG4]|uniref:Putative 4-hydroxy-4-methyl-2-oxoglutarate aldolase n=1 Tax=Halovulum marinum TaxID=2662447 RepID=A0A6L5Z454_9RHOB|nr:RraA family protein [Halovulum marinum]MSU90802.1 RraA family protein [Halovulum marinum]